MLTIAGILFYLLIFTWLISRYLKQEQEKLQVWQVALALGFKTLMGCLYGYIFLVSYNGDDTWQMHNYAIEQQQILRNDPVRFFTEFSPAGVFGRYESTSKDIYYYLHDLEAWLMAKPFAIINFVTGANYYINLVFFNALVFFGHYWFYQLMIRKFKVNSTAAFVSVFLFPPVVFWLSGLRADGVLLFFLMLAIRSFDILIRGKSAWPVFGLIVGLGGLIILRSAFAVLLLPGLAAWALVIRSGKRVGIAFAGVYGICLFIFLGSGLLPGENSLTGIVAERQRAFSELEANTRFELPRLTAEPESFLIAAPRAALNVFARPFPTEAQGTLQIAASMEVILVVVLILICLVWHVSDWKSVVSDPVFVNFLCFSFILCMLVGLTVPFPGAIVRYRIIPELIFISLLVSLIDWKRITLIVLKK